MENFDVAALIGQRVIVKFSSVGEQKGVIEGVNYAHPASDKEEAVNSSRFAVRLENGESLESGGRNFSYIEPSAIYP